MTKKEFRQELKNIQEECLFWSRRLSYNSAKYYSEWQVKYKEACKRRDELYRQELSMAYKEYIGSSK